MTRHELVILFLSLGVLLAAAHCLRVLAIRLRQPAVLGEILAGILLGPTLLGRWAPETFATVFPATGPVAQVISGLAMVAVTLFLLVAGLEIDLSVVARQSRRAVLVGLCGLVLPFAVGFGTAFGLRDSLFAQPDRDPLVFALFFATALAISALPVIVKILRDLELYRTDLGLVIVAGAMFDDLVGWTLFGALLGMLPDQGHAPDISPLATLLAAIGLLALMLTAGRWVFDRALRWLALRRSQVAGTLGFVLSVAFFGAALAEAIGLHALFGAFLCGVALGDSRYLRANTRSTLDEFISFIFAPLFFATIGLHLDFVAHFDPLLVVVVLLIATLGKVLGAGLGARLSGLPARASWAVGFGMNARGAMEIVLGLAALQAGLIRERMFVALVVMALVTSATAGTAIQMLLRPAGAGGQSSSGEPPSSPGRSSSRGPVALRLPPK